MESETLFAASPGSNYLANTSTVAFNVHGAFVGFVALCIIRRMWFGCSLSFHFWRMDADSNVVSRSSSGRNSPTPDSSGAGMSKEPRMDGVGGNWAATRPAAEIALARKAFNLIAALGS